MDYGRLILLIGLLVYYSVKYIKEKKVRNLAISLICALSLISVLFIINPDKNIEFYNFLNSGYIKILDIILLVLIFILPSRKKIKEKSF